MTAYAGGVVEIEDFATPKVIARARRTSNSGNITTTETGYVELNDVPMIGGHVYEIRTGAVSIDSSVAADCVQCNIRYTEDGSTPSIASTARIMWRGEVSNATNSPIETMSILYFPATDVTFSCWFTAIRVSGTGNIVISHNGTSNPFDLTIIDWGTDPGETGVDL